MAIVCEILPKQKDLLFKAVASDLLAMVQEGKKFVLSDYVKDMFNLLQENGLDFQTSIAYAALVPSNIKRLYGQDEQIDELIAAELPTLQDVSKKIKDADYVVQYLGLTPSDPQANQKINEEEEALKKRKEKEAANSANLNGKVFSAKPNSLNSTTGNSSDPDKAFTYAFLKNLVDSGSIESTSSGYYITLMDASGVITEADSSNKSNYKGLVQVITDASGNPIYFDDAFNSTTRETGKLVFFRLRGGDPSFEKVLGSLQTMDELIRTTGYSTSKEVLDNLKAEHKLALKKKKYIEGGKGRKIVQHITGASKGFLVLADKSENKNNFDLSTAPDLSGGSIFIDVIDVETSKQRNYFLRDFNNSSAPIPFVTKPVETLGDEFLSKAADIILGRYMENGVEKKITDVDGDSENENILTYRRDFLYTFFGNNSTVKISKEGDVYYGKESERKKVEGDLEASKKLLIEALTYNPQVNKKHSINVLQLTSNQIPFFKQIGKNLAIDPEGMSEVEYKRFIQKNSITSAKIDESGNFEEHNGYIRFRTPVEEINKMDSAEVTTAPTTGTKADNTISNGDKIIKVQTKPVTDEITNTAEDLFISADKNPEGRIHINMEPLKDVLVVPNNTITVIDKKTGKEIINKELNPEGAVIFEAMQGRLFVVANINGQLVPFYKSSAGTSGKKQGEWYPFFGYTGAWLVKGRVDKATGEMKYSPEIDKVTTLLNENLVFPDKYIDRSTNTIKNTKGEVIIDMNQSFKINRLWQKEFGSQTGEGTNYQIKGLKENTRSESGLVALITGLNTTELDSSKTPKELSEWLNLISKNTEPSVSKGTQPSAQTSTETTVTPAAEESFPVPTIEELQDEDLLNIDELTEPDYDAPKGKTDEDPDDVFNKLKSQASADEKVTKEQIAESIKWWNSSNNVLKPHVRYIEAFDQINAANPQSIATFTKAGITLYKGSDSTQLYHEAWHAFTQMFLTKKERDNLYDEVKKMAGSFVDFNGNTVKFSDPNITDKQIEEYLAEDFRKFMLSGGKGVSTKTPVKKSIFQTILDILKILFGYNLNDGMSNMQASFNLNDLYNNLRTGQNIRTTPIGLDADFEVLNKINPVDQKYQNLSDSLSYSDAMTIVDSIDSFFSEHEDESNKLNGNSEFTSTILSSAKQRANAYNGFLLRSIREYKDVVNKIKTAKEEKSNDLPELVRKKKLLEFTIANFSVSSTKGQSVTGKDIVDASTNNLGVIAYHMQKSKYLNFDERFLIDDIEEKTTNDKDGYGHRSGNEKSMKELASDEVLYTIRSLFEYKDGVPVKNELGFNKLMPFDSAWNKVQRVLEDIYDIDDQYNALQKAASTDPMFAQLISKLGNPNRFSSAEFSVEDKNSKENMKRVLLLNNLWTKFHNSFNGKRIPLVQLTVDIKTGAQGISGIDIKPGKAQTSTSKIARDWEANFSNPTIIAARQKFINYKPQVANENVLRKFKGNTLNIEAVVEEFRTSHANDPIPFLKVLGMEIPEVPEMHKLLTDKLKILPRSLMKKLISINAFNKKNPNDAVEIGSIDQLIKMNYEDRNEDSSYKELLDNVIKYSDKYGDTMVSTATGSARWELSLRSTISQQIDAWNGAESFQDLIADPKMAHLDTKRNPFIEGTIIATETFGTDLTKRELTKKVSGREAFGRLELLNSSGVTMLINNAYTGLSVDSAEADELTQSLHNFYSYILYGVSEATRHADKSTSYWYKMRFRDGRKHYIPMSSFASYKRLNDSKQDILETSGMQQARKQFLKYISAEVSRINKLRSGDIAGTATVGDKTYKEVGSDFVNMEDVLPKELRNQIKKNYLSDDFFGQMMNPKTDADIKLRNDIENAINNYLIRQTERFKSDINNTGIFSNDLLFSAVRKEILGKNATNKLLLNPENYTDFIDESAVMGYIVNDWIQKYETTVIFYGDPALYNHLKEEFHKRNAGLASTGTIPRSDESINRFLNEIMPRRYASSVWYKNQAPPAPKKEGKVMSTAILGDVKAQSVYFDEYIESIKKSEAKRLGVKSLTKEQEKDIEDALGDYKKMTTGDGQGWISFDAYRSLLIRLGKWSPEHEDLYNDILDGKDVSVSLANKFFNVKKMQYWGPLAAKAGLPLQAFHKFSLMPLIPTLIKGTNLEILHNKMVSQGIDYATFQSGSKINSITKDGKVDKFYNDSTAKDTTPAFLNDDYTFTPNDIFIDYFKDQVEISDQYKGQVIFSTQLRKLVEIGLMEYGVPTDFKPNLKDAQKRIAEWKKALDKGETTPNYTKLLNYESLIGKLTEYKKRELIREAGIKEVDGKITLSDKLLEFVKKELTRQDLAEHDIDFIKYDPTTKTLVYDLSYHPSAEKIERLLTGIVYKRLIRQKINGEALVQVSGAGFEPAGLRKATDKEQRAFGTNFLPFYNQKKNGETSAMKVKIAIQGDFKKLLRHPKVLELVKDSGNKITALEALNILIKNEDFLNEGDNRKMITISGVRIPVQGLNSMEFAEVYEFLPENSGNMIILPSEIVAKSGSDFDIDKMTMMFPSIISTSKGVSLVKYNRTDENNLESNKKTLKDKYNQKDAVTEKLFNLVFRVEEEGKIKVNDQLRSAIQSIRDKKQEIKEEMAVLELEAKDQLDKNIELDAYYNEIIELNDELDQLFEGIFQTSAAAKKINNEELIPLQKEIDDLKVAIASGTSKGIENDILSSVVDILKLENNFTDFITPNSTDLVKPLAKKYSRYVRDYDPYETVSNDGKSYTDENGKNRISATRIFELGYNRFKQISNNIGKKTLGMGAVDNTYNAVFNRIGFHMSPSFDIFIKGETEEEDVTIPIRQILRMPHNSIKVKGEDAISLAGLYDVNKKNSISTVISQMINGWVDVAKDSWIFDIQGNSEISPSLLFMIQAGVPLEQAVAFVSQPAIRDYVSQQRFNKSTFSMALGATEDQANYYRMHARVKMLQRLGISVPEEVVSKPSFTLKRYLYTDLMPKLLGDSGMKNSASEKIFSLQELDKNIMGVMDLEDKKVFDIMTFLHFLEIEDMSSATTTIKLGMNFDTSKTKSLYESKQKLDKSLALDYNDRLPEGVREKIETSSAIGSFNVQPFTVSLLSNFFNFRADPSLQSYLSKIDNNSFKTKMPGAFRDKNQMLSAFTNDFSSYLFQQNLYSADYFNTGDSYKGASIVSSIEPTRGLNRAVFVRKEDGVYKMYVDFTQMDKDFKSSAYSKESYRTQFGYAPVESNLFKHPDPTVSKNLYYQFVYERESLRQMIPFAEFKETAFFTNAVKEIRKTFKKDKEQSQENYDKELSRRAYEEFLKQKALLHKINIPFIMKNKNGYANQVMSIDALFPNLKNKYKLLSSLQYGNNGATKNLKLTEYILESETLNMYNEDLEKLADVNVIKSTNKLENQLISNLFSHFALFSLLQAGQDSKGIYSLGKIVNPVKIADLLKPSVEKYMTLASMEKLTTLSSYNSMFISQHTAVVSPEDDMMGEKPAYRKKRIKTYFGRPPQKKTKVKVLESKETTTAKIITTDNFNPDIVMYDLTSEVKNFDEAVTSITAWAKSSPENEIIVFDDAMTEFKSPTDVGGSARANIYNSTLIRDLIAQNAVPAEKTFGLKIKSRGSMRVLSDFTLIDTEEKLKDFMNQVDDYVEQLLSLQNDPNNPKVLIFNKEGHGLSLLGYGKSERMTANDKIMKKVPQGNQDAYAYLSEQLYKNFGYINPGYLDTLMKDPGANPETIKISNEEVEEIIYQCFYA